MRPITVEEDWEHVLTQKVVTLNTCREVACLTFQLPHITTGFFQIHRRQPTTGSLQSLRIQGRIFDRNLPDLKRISAVSQYEEEVLSECFSGFLSGPYFAFWIVCPRNDTLVSPISHIDGLSVRLAFQIHSKK